MERFVENPSALLDDVPDNIDKLKLFYYEEVDQKRKQMAEFLIELFNGADVEVRIELASGWTDTKGLLRKHSGKETGGPIEH